MKKIILFILLMFINFSTFSQYGQEIDVSDAIKASLDLKTSAVKIAKDYIYRGLKSEFVAKENDVNLAAGEKSLLMLEIYAQKFPELKPALNKVKAMWKKSRIISLQNPDRKKMKGLLMKLKVFMDSSDKLTEKIKKTNNINIIDYQQASNNMGLLAQQITLLYAMQIAKIDDPALNQEMNTCKINFQKNLDKTFFSGENTVDITENLKRIQADWELGKKSIEKRNESLLNTLYIMMNKISEESKKAAQLYQEKAKKEIKKQ